MKLNLKKPTLNLKKPTLELHHKHLKREKTPRAIYLASMMSKEK